MTGMHHVAEATVPFTSNAELTIAVAREYVEDVALSCCRFE